MGRFWGTLRIINWQIRATQIEQLTRLYFELWKNKNSPLLTRAYAHTNKRLRFFAVTSVTLYLQTTHNQRDTDYNQVYFNNSVIKPLKRRNFGKAKHIVTTSFFVYFSSFFRHHFTTNVTLVTAKKTKSLLEGARATRARTPTREKLLLLHSICGTSFLYVLHFLSHHSTSIAPNDTPQCLLIVQKNQHTDTSQHFFTVQSLVFNPNRSLDPELISLDCWADGWLWVRRRSGLRRERTSNKMPTRKWKMAGRHILGNILHNNGLMTDWGLGFIGAYIHRRWHRKVQQSFPSFLFHHLNI